MMTDLEKVVDFMHCANQPTPVTPIIPDEKRVELRLKLIREEFEELQQGIENKNLTEIMDAFCDLEYVLLGAIVEFGMKDCFQENFYLVHESNMTKFDNNDYDAMMTRNQYELDGVETYYRQIGNKWVTFRKEDDKVLKSLNYKPVKIQI